MALRTQTADPMQSPVRLLPSTELGAHGLRLPMAGKRGVSAPLFAALRTLSEQCAHSCPAGHPPRRPKQDAAALGRPSVRSGKPHAVEAWSESCRNDRPLARRTGSPQVEWMRVQAPAIEQSIDNYVLLRRLGDGSMGAVYEARHTQIERRVAIKILHKELSDDPEIIQRFTNEARIVNIIGHAGLVSITESGQTRDGSRYIVMEYVDGINLRDYVAGHGGRLPVEHVLRITRQVASTLAAAHAKQIVHRDLKPANIMLVRETSDREVAGGDPAASSAQLPDALPEKLKILDFGIAKIINNGLGQTRTGVAMGTPIYMSPEQCRSGRNAVDRSDVYALGVIAYELLAGAPPFQGGAAVLMAAHLMQDPPPLLDQAPQTPPALARLIHAMLGKSPNDRPSAAEVARLLAELGGARTTASQAYAILPGERQNTAHSMDSLGEEAQSQADAQSALHSVPLRLRGKLLAASAAFLLLLGSLLVLLLWTLTRQPVSPPTPHAQRPRSLPLGPIGQASSDPANPQASDGGTAADAGATGQGAVGSTSHNTRTTGSSLGTSTAPTGSRSKANPSKTKKKKPKGSRRSTK